MSDQGDSPWWLYSKDVITPDDILRVHQEAIDAGCDPQQMERILEQSVLAAGGIESLARLWTERIQFERGMAGFREQLNRRRVGQKTPTPAPTITPAPAPKVDTEAALRELVRRFPDVARAALADTDGDSEAKQT